MILLGSQTNEKAGGGGYGECGVLFSALHSTSVAFSITSVRSSIAAADGVKNKRYFYCEKINLKRGQM